MKSVQGPYPKFNHYYPLEEIIDLYMEIWYDDDSDSDDWLKEVNAELNKYTLSKVLALYRNSVV